MKTLHHSLDRDPLLRERLGVPMAFCRHTYGTIREHKLVCWPRGSYLGVILLVKHGAARPYRVLANHKTWGSFKTLGPAAKRFRELVKARAA